MENFSSSRNCKIAKLFNCYHLNFGGDTANQLGFMAAADERATYVIYEMRNELKSLAAGTSTLSGFMSNMVDLAEEFGDYMNDMDELNADYILEEENDFLNALLGGCLVEGFEPRAYYEAAKSEELTELVVGCFNTIKFLALGEIQIDKFIDYIGDFVESYEEAWGRAFSEGADE